MIGINQVKRDNKSNNKREYIMKRKFSLITKSFVTEI